MFTYLKPKSVKEIEDMLLKTSSKQLMDFFTAANTWEKEYRILQILSLRGEIGLFNKIVNYTRWRKTLPDKHLSLFNKLHLEAYKNHKNVYIS